MKKKMMTGQRQVICQENQCLNSIPQRPKLDKKQTLTVAVELRFNKVIIDG